MARNIKYIVVHCTAGNQRATEADLRAEFKRKGWKNPGYHYVIFADGRVVQLLDESGVANGVYGYNKICIHVAYTGGVDTSKPNLPAIDNRTNMQRAQLSLLLRIIKKRYPQATIVGHHDLNQRKACPSFNARTEYADI